MKVTAEKLPESQVLLTIEADEETTRKAQESAYRRVVQKVNVPGFRRGKAPRQMVERLYGRETILQESAQVALPKLYHDALHEADIDPLYDPEIDIVSFEPLTFKITVPVRPEVNLPDYSGVRLPRPEVSVDESEVELTLANLREQRAEWAPVEREAQMGDLAVISAKATDGEEELLEEKEIEYLVDAERGMPVPGFAEQLVGAKAGDERNFKLSFPEDYRIKELAGKEADFQVTLHSLKEKHLPELDDELAKSLGEFDSFDALRDSVRERLLANAQASADTEYEEAVIAKLLETMEVELPKQMVEEQAEHSLHDLEDRLQAQQISMPVFLNATKQTRMELTDSLKEDAKLLLRRQLLLNEVVNREGIEVSDEEVEAEIESAIAFFGERAEAGRKVLDTPDSRRNIAFRLSQRKARERLVEIGSQTDEQATEAAAQTEPSAEEQPAQEATAEPVAPATEPEAEQEPPAKENNGDVEPE